MARNGLLSMILLTELVLILVLLHYRYQSASVLFMMKLITGVKGKHYPTRHIIPPV